MDSSAIRRFFQRGRNPLSKWCESRAGTRLDPGSGEFIARIAAEALPSGGRCPHAGRAWLGESCPGGLIWALPGVGRTPRTGESPACRWRGGQRRTNISSARSGSDALVSAGFSTLASLVCPARNSSGHSQSFSRLLETQWPPASGQVSGIAGVWVGRAGPMPRTARLSSDDTLLHQNVPWGAGMEGVHPAVQPRVPRTEDACTSPRGVGAVIGRGGGRLPVGSWPR